MFLRSALNRTVSRVAHVSYARSSIRVVRASQNARLVVAV